MDIIIVVIGFASGLFLLVSLAHWYSNGTEVARAVARRDKAEQLAIARRAAMRRHPAGRRAR